MILFLYTTMYKLLLLFVLAGFTANAQVNFWTANSIIDKQQQPELEALKVKAAYAYTTSEHWQVGDSTHYDQITDYDAGERKTVLKIYRTDWAKNKRYYGVIDSFFYNDKGVLTMLKRYEPQNEGQYYALVYALKSVINKKALIEKLEAYSGYNAEELESYDMYEYDKKNRITAVTTYRTNAGEEKPAFVKDMAWKFEYDKKGNITKATATSAIGGGTEYRMKYNEKGLLVNYTEWYNGKELQNETNYTYDDKGRTTQRNYSTPYNYNDTIQYWYDGERKIPYRIYLTYPRMNGDGYAHEYTVYKFDYYK